MRHVPDELLVRFKRGVPEQAAARALSRVPAAFVRRFRSVERLYHLKLERGASLHRSMRTLAADPSVSYAEPNFVLNALAVPNDPAFSSLWALDNRGQTGGTPDADIDAVEAWGLTTGSASVVVAVIDTGLDYAHPDLAANAFQNLADCDADGLDDDGNGYVDDCRGIDTINDDSDPMDDHGHGTHVAGTIGAAGNNSVGVAGVNWSVKVLPCKFLDATGTGNTAGAVACLDYVASLKDHGVNVVASNNSWGGGLFSRALRDAIVAQRDRGILFIAAAGNQGLDNDALGFYPCAYDPSNVVCVGATDNQDSRPWFSNYGRGTVHLAAPGVSILSTTPGGTYDARSGTSMAAPHVAGVAALLYAQEPTRDWKAVKNLLLAGGDARPSLSGSFITGKRLDALGSLACNGANVTSRMRPLATQMEAAVGATLELAVLNVSCADPAGSVTVDVSPSSESIALSDDGLAPDQVAGDGIYAATWSPASAGTFDLSFPDQTSVRVRVDPHLQRGFPVSTFASAGSYHSGPAIHTLVGNIDGDPQLEILVTGLAQGPLYAWKADGTPAPGWPAYDVPGAAYPTLGELDDDRSGLEVFSSHYAATQDLVARSGSAVVLPGWPRASNNYVASPASLADLDRDGLDEIFVEEEDWALHAYKADGSTLSGWPIQESIGGQERHTPAVADLDGDGAPEIVTASGSGSWGSELFAYHGNGARVAGFPVNFPGFADTFPVVGDVDGDGTPEIVITAQADLTTQVRVYSAAGVLERTLTAAGTVFYGTAPALADLDGDGFPEIIVQANGALNVWKGDGSVLPGWPQVWSTGHWLGNSAPVVGDVTGDGLPDIVVTSQEGGSCCFGEVRVYDRQGNLYPGFPKPLSIGRGAVPAIADIDLDGRNEIVVSGSFWNGHRGYYPTVWVYDLGGGPHGPILWGQFMGGPRHQGSYPVKHEPRAASEVLVFRAGAWMSYDLDTTLWTGGVWTGSAPGCIPAPMDYDGDGRLDLAQWCDGAWHFYNSDGTYRKGIWTGAVPGDRPVPADYDGDRVDDIVVFRGGDWLFFDFSTGAWSPERSVRTGLPPHWTGGTPVPVPMDHDGDGKADFTVYSGGPWHFFHADGRYNKGIWTGGVPGDLPVPADYDGVGGEDVVVFRSGAWLFFDFATGAWLPDRSVWTGAPPHWTGGTSLPAPLDHDGDGNADFTVYSGGPWHFYENDGTYSKGIWTGGVAGDQPISRRLLP